MSKQLANFQLTQRDCDILECLSLKVRMFSIEQIGRTWWWGNRHKRSNALKRLRILEREGLIEIFEVLSHPEIELRKPLAIWKPGRLRPDFAKLSYLLKHRWPDSHQMTSVAIATAKTAGRFGGFGGRRPRRAEMTHDIHVSAVFLKFKTFRVSDARIWMSEDNYDAQREQLKGAKLPDAVLEKEDGFLAIEFGGAYDKKKLAAFHRWCQSEQMPYEIW